MSVVLDDGPPLVTGGEGRVETAVMRDEGPVSRYQGYDWLTFLPCGGHGQTGRCVTSSRQGPGTGINPSQHMEEEQPCSGCIRYSTTSGHQGISFPPPDL